MYAYICLCNSHETLIEGVTLLDQDTLKHALLLFDLCFTLAEADLSLGTVQATLFKQGLMTVIPDGTFITVNSSNRVLRFVEFITLFKFIL